MPSQVYAAASSQSFSLLATGIDSVFDLGSNVLLFWLHRKAQKMDINRWPVGGARLETIGNIVYGTSAALVSNRLLNCHRRFFVRMELSISVCIVTNYHNLCRMGSVNLVVIVESARSLITTENEDLKQFHIISIIGVAAATGNHPPKPFIWPPLDILNAGVKFILFIYCYALRSKSSQVEVLWEDHRNDLWINTFGNDLYVELPCRD
jgi:hypothetical protein